MCTTMKFRLFSLAALALTLLAPADLYSASSPASAVLKSAEAKANAHDFIGALADYDQAVQLDPQNALAYGMRGVVKQIQGDFNGSIADFRKSLQLAPVSLTRFYLTIALRRAHQDAATAGLTAAVKTWPEGWEKAEGNFLAGNMSEKDFLAAAEKGDAKLIPQQECEAFYYAGMTRFFNSDLPGAKDYLTKCTDLKLTENLEDMLARGELARLAASKTGSPASATGKPSAPVGPPAAK